MNTMHVIYISFVIIIAVAHTGCSKTSGCKDPYSLNYAPDADYVSSNCEYPAISLRSNLYFNNNHFQLHKFESLNGYTIVIESFKIYFSDITLTDFGNTVWSIDDLYILQDHNEQQYELFTVNKTQYKQLSLNIGLDSLINNKTAQYLKGDNDHVLSEQPDSMHYADESSFIFMKITGKIDLNKDGFPSENESFCFKIGQNDYFKTMQFPVNLDANKQENIVNLSIDIARLFDGLDLRTQHYTNSKVNKNIAQTIINNYPSAFDVK